MTPEGFICSVSESEDRARRRCELRNLARELDAEMEKAPRVLQPGLYAAAEYLRQKARNVR